MYTSYDEYIVDYTTSSIIHCTRCMCLSACLH